MVEFTELQIIEMEKYKYYLGEKLGHDPLLDRSLENIYCEWIEKYAYDFRKNYENTHIHFSEFIIKREEEKKNDTIKGYADLGK